MMTLSLILEMLDELVLTSGQAKPWCVPFTENSVASGLQHSCQCNLSLSGPGLCSYSSRSTGLLCAYSQSGDRILFGFRCLKNSFVMQ